MKRGLVIVRRTITELDISAGLSRPSQGAFHNSPFPTFIGARGSMIQEPELAPVLELSPFPSPCIHRGNREIPRVASKPQLPQGSSGRLRSLGLCHR
jgi:hypothetical protein